MFSGVVLDYTQLSHGNVGTTERPRQEAFIVTGRRIKGSVTGDSKARNSSIQPRLPLGINNIMYYMATAKQLQSPKSSGMEGQMSEAILGVEDGVRLVYPGSDVKK